MWLIVRKAVGVKLSTWFPISEIDRPGAPPSQLSRIMKDFCKTADYARVDLKARVLNKKPGFSGHMVVVFDARGDIYSLHDPGLPPQPNRQVSKKDLAEAWHYVGPEKASLVAIKQG